MKDCHCKEDHICKKEYVSNNTDIIANQAVTSTIPGAQRFSRTELEKSKNLNTYAAENLEFFETEEEKEESVNIRLAPHFLKPYPFTFITAVKKKISQGEQSDIFKKVEESKENTETIGSNDFSECLNEKINKEMEFIKPLKVPDFKISPKTVDHSARESSSMSEVFSVKKFDVLSKDSVHKETKTPKSSDRVQRKLDFFSSDSSLLQNDNDDRLKSADELVLTSLVKKKDHFRDSSRDKENRSKRIRKDDSSSSKADNSSQDASKKLKSIKSISKRDNPDLVFKKIGTEHFLCHTPRNSDFGLKKSRNKHFVTSTVKKDDDKKYRCSSSQYSKTLKDKSLKLKGKSINNEPVNLSDKNTKFQDRLLSKESYSEISTESDDRKSKDESKSSIPLKLEDEKSELNPDSRHSKQQSRSSSYSHSRVFDILSKEQIKRVSNKHKYMYNTDNSDYNVSSSDILEEVKTVSDSNVSFPKHQTQSESCEILTQASKIKEIEKPASNSVHQSNEQNISRSSEPEFFTSQSSAKHENPLFHSGTREEINSDSKSFLDASFSEMLLDPRRISFRDDSYSQQNEFTDLVTPEMNLMLRPKRRRQFLQGHHKEFDHKNLRNKQAAASEMDEKSNQSLRSTVSQMKYQAEDSFLDSLNDSLHQGTYDGNLYNANREEGNQKEEAGDSELKRQLIALQTETIDGINKGECPSTNKEIHNANLGFTNKSLKGSTSSSFKKSNLTSQENIHQSSTQNAFNKVVNNTDNKLKLAVKVAEVQTQTANDIATQTDVNLYQSKIFKRLKELSGITYERGTVTGKGIPQFSLESLDEDNYNDYDYGQVDSISLTSKMKTMSEISLHETTSSIKTETGTEISISTRDVTCSFNKDLALEMAQLVQDEKQRYDKIQMLFKSREKTLNDRTKKLVKLEEQKRQLRDTGQDSRISSVKKKQRALLLKLQQEKDEMNRLKELHKIASQERKLMLQKHRDMFNPEMSTKNILTKLKRCSDCHSPRRLSGPMKGYDIRSNSSVSSLVDSDKSQLERSQIDMNLKTPDTGFQKNRQHLKLAVNAVAAEKSDSDKLDTADVKNGSTLSTVYQSYMIKPVENPKYDIKSRKFEEKMPRGDILRQIELHSKLKQDSIVGLPGQCKESKNVDLPLTCPSKPVYNDEKPESDTIIEKLSRKSKILNLDHHMILKNKSQQKVNSDPDVEDKSKKEQTSAILDEFLHINSKLSKKLEKDLSADKDTLKKVQQASETKLNSKRKSSKNQKTKVSDELMESFLRPKSDSQIWEEVIGHHNKRSKLDIEQSDDHYSNSILKEFEFSESENSLQALIKHSKAVNDKNYQLLRDIASDVKDDTNIETFEGLDKKNEQLKNFPQNKDQFGSTLGNLSTRSQVSTLTISRHSSGDSEKSYSKSVVIRSQGHRFKTSKKLEQILNAREAALASRRTCVEEWIAWHTRLREEENRVARMEQAAYKLVNAASKALFYPDNSVSSDASDVEGRIDLLAQKLADRRTEMARLKKEAKKQAKQRLRAMEASLLNQIKKYDATINEMRKTLETKKDIVKNSEKVSLESKSVSDFKIPEIPIKNLQDIYLSNDLLQPRQESDSNNLEDRVAGSKKLLENKCNNHEIKKLSIPQDISEYNQQAFKDIDTENSSTEVTSNKFHQFNKEFNVASEINSTGLKDLPTSSSESTLCEQGTTNETRSLNTLDNNIVRKSDSKEISTLKPNQVTNVISSMSIEENKLSTNSITEKSLKSVTDSVEKVVPSVVCSENISLSFSNKLDSLGANGKNLNDDISVLESDLKTLSEMMLQISNKKSINNVVSSSRNEKDYCDKRTSEDVSEDLPSSESTRESNTISSKLSELQKTDVVDEANSANEIDDIISDDGKTDESFVNRMPKTVDFQAKSKEILNEIEKSIICDHLKSLDAQAHDAFEEGMRNLRKESQILSNDLTSLEGDIKSISEILSKATQKESTFENISVDCESEASKAHLELDCRNSVNQVAEKIETSSLSQIQDTNKMSVDLEKSACTFSNTDLVNTEENKHKSKFSIDEIQDDLLQKETIRKENLIAEQQEENDFSNEISKSASEANEDNMSSLESGEVDSSVALFQKENSEILDSFEQQNAPSVVVTIDKQITDLKETENSISTEKVLTIEDNLSADVEVLKGDSMFIPKGESTNIETPIANLENKEINDNLNSSQIVDVEVEKKQTKLNKTIDESNLLNNDKNQLENLDCNYVFRKLFMPSVLIVSELDSQSLDGYGLLSVDVEPRVTFPDELATGKENNATDEDNLTQELEIREYSESSEEQYSSEGEQLDNFVEVAEDKLEIFDKSAGKLVSDSGKLVNFMQTYSVLKDPQYEDISEENLEISIILDNDSQKSTSMTGKYDTDVVKIADDILLKSMSETNEQKADFYIDSQDPHSSESDLELKATEGESDETTDNQQMSIDNFYTNEKLSNDDSSESSEGDANKELSKVIISSPRNDSRVEIANLKEDLLSRISLHKSLESKTDFQVTPIVTTAEKEIMSTIDKLKASLKQPGLEVAELDATLLRIEQLQIELEIKKLEAEEVSYYVREIPNKPPPPYTPPSSGKLSTSQSSPSPPPIVIPTSVDDLTTFIEKATSIIFKAKEEGEDIMGLEASPEIYELRKDTDALKKDRRIYNTFLFDLCKETIAEVYCMNDDKPGPSWTRPNVKTKPAVKVPKDVEELIEYVNKEVATLFGFKTKLQRENMVMRWSRKRRDRVDELLAREAQAEEEEWTKFHYDELAVKNELTVAILNSVILETMNVVKTAFTKKRKIKV